MDESLSPSSRAKLKNRNAAMELKFGSPKLKEVLRQRCRVRIRNKREALVNSFRQIAISHDEVSTIVQEELLDVCNNFPDDDSGISSQCSSDEPQQKSLSSDKIASLEDKIIMDEYERLINDDAYIQHLEQLLKDEVVCPICMKGMLKKFTEEVAECQECKENLYTPGGIQDLQKRCYEAAAGHQEHCQTAPNFIKIPNGSNSLYIVCLNCSYLEPVL